jgi:hypothetical protein
MIPQSLYVSFEIHVYNKIQTLKLKLHKLSFFFLKVDLFLCNLGYLTIPLSLFYDKCTGSKLFFKAKGSGSFRFKS